ncbi:MAG: hypothetical protein IPO43_12880 [Rhodoferax sp.]|nr:hypothetical protein [Rhodoferax sp.]
MRLASNSPTAGAGGQMPPRNAVPVRAPVIASEPLAAYGIHPRPSRGGIVSNELIDRLRDAEGI